VCFVCHGRSSAKAIRNAVLMAHRFSRAGLLQRVEQEIAIASVS
jgi:hypothetical protein